MDRTGQSINEFSSWYNTVFTEGDGIYLKDLEGNHYIGFTWASSRNLEFRHPAIVAAARGQRGATGVGSPPGVHQGLVLFSEKLKEFAPPSLSTGRVGFCNTGLDATEAAMLLARAYTGRQILFAYLGGHHGSSSMGACSMTADRSKNRRLYLPLLLSVVHVLYPNCYRCKFGQAYPSCGLSCIDPLSYILDTTFHPEEMAAFFIESIQSTEMMVPPKDYFSSFKYICKEHEILLVDDDVIIGFGRTGKMWGIDHLSIEPDIMYLAKSITNGISLGALLGTGEIMERDAQYHLVHDGAFGGNPVACACALAHLEVLKREKLVANTAKVGDYTLRRLKELAETHALIGDVRGKGLFIGIELVKDLRSKQPATKEADRVVTEAFYRGVILQATGTYRQVLRLVPPLILTTEEVETAITILEEALDDVKRHSN